MIINFGLSSNTISQINAVFIQYPTIEKVVIYGSRATGKYKVGSDIDLVMYGNDLNYQIQMDIFDALDELLLPYSIDLAIYHTLNHDNLKEHINNVGQIFYKKKPSGC